MFRSPKGAGRARLYVDGLKVEDYWRAHQVPIQPDSPEHIRQIEQWLHSYRPEELFDENGVPVGAAGLPAEGHAPHGREPARKRRTAAEGPENAGLPRLRRGYPVPRQRRGAGYGRAGTFVRDIYKLNEVERNFRSFGPDETASNRLTPVFEERGGARGTARPTTRTTISRPTAG